MTRPLLYSMLAALLVAAVAPGCKEKTVEASQEPTTSAGPKTVKFDPKALGRLGIKVEAAGSTTGELDLAVPGSLEYNLDKYAEVGSLVDGRVTQMSVKVGDAVKKGQLLATIVVPSIASAQADYISAEAAAPKRSPITISGFSRRWRQRLSSFFSVVSMSYSTRWKLQALPSTVT